MTLQDLAALKADIQNLLDEYSDTMKRLGALSARASSTLSKPEFISFISYFKEAFVKATHDSGERYKDMSIDQIAEWNVSSVDVINKLADDNDPMEEAEI